MKQVRLNTIPVRAWLLTLGVLLVWTGCADNYPGPDKQFAGSMAGAATGAGAGAVTGFQLGAGTGPGALAGAGFGFVAGGIHGYVKDQLEEDLLYLSAQTQKERSIAVAHEILADHYRRRIELHPTRDIYPADLFFYGDEAKLCTSAEQVVREIVKLNKNRYPWSRLVLAYYIRSADDAAEYATSLADRRLEMLGDQFVRAGIDPRRIEARTVIVEEPVLIDPADDPSRYNQAIEIIPWDR